MNTANASRQYVKRDWSDALEAKKKRRRKEPLDPREVAALKEYEAWNNARATRIYWADPDERAEMEARAKAAKRRFSEWCTEAVRRYARGERIDPRFLAEIQEQLSSLKGEAERERDKAEEYRQEAKVWSERYHELAEELGHRAKAKLKKQTGKVA